MEYVSILSRCLSIERKNRKAMSVTTLSAFRRDSERRLKEMDEGEKLLKEVFTEYKNLIKELYEENEESERRLSELE